MKMKINCYARKAYKYIKNLIIYLIVDVDMCITLSIILFFKEKGNDYLCEKLNITYYLNISYSHMINLP